jgi:hydrogenase maturation protease
MQNKEKNILILGMGNDILTDDGIGIKLLKDLKEIFPALNADFETLFVGSLEIIEFLAGYKSVIILDAIKTQDGIAGDVYHLTPEDFRSSLHIDNIHDISFLNALKLGKDMGYDMPQKVDIIAVEIIEDLVFSDKLTPQLQQKYPQILKDAEEIVNELINDVRF